MLHFDRTTASVVYISIRTSISTYAVIRVYLAVRIFRGLFRKKKKKGRRKKEKEKKKRDKSLAKVPGHFDRPTKNKRVYLLICLSKIRSTNCRDKTFREISKFAKFQTVAIINSLLDAYGVTGKTNELVNWLSNLPDIITTFLFTDALFLNAWCSIAIRNEISSDKTMEKREKATSIFPPHSWSHLRSSSTPGYRWQRLGEQLSVIPDLTSRDGIWTVQPTTLDAWQTFRVIANTFIRDRKVRLKSKTNRSHTFWNEETDQRKLKCAEN